MSNAIGEFIQPIPWIHTLCWCWWCRYQIPQRVASNNAIGDVGFSSPPALNEYSLFVCSGVITGVFHIDVVLKHLCFVAEKLCYFLRCFLAWLIVVKADDDGLETVEPFIRVFAIFQGTSSAAADADDSPFTSCGLESR